MKRNIKERIADAWLSEATRKSPDKITVQELVVKCEISRQTFYKYFQDIIDVMRWVCERDLENAYKGYTEIEDSNSAMAFFVSRIMEKHGILCKVLGSNFHEQARQIFEGSLRRLVIEEIEKRTS